MSDLFQAGIAAKAKTTLFCYLRTFFVYPLFRSQALVCETHQLFLSCRHFLCNVRTFVCWACVIIGTRITHLKKGRTKEDNPSETPVGYAGPQFWLCRHYPVQHAPLAHFLVLFQLARLLFHHYVCLHEVRLQSRAHLALCPIPKQITNAILSVSGCLKSPELMSSNLFFFFRFTERQCACRSK